VASTLNSHTVSLLVSLDFGQTITINKRIASNEVNAFDFIIITIDLIFFQILGIFCNQYNKTQLLIQLFGRYSSVHNY